MPRPIDLDRWYVQPMLAVAVSAVPPGQWRLEMKFDGFRAIAAVDSGKAELWSRNRLAFGVRFPEIREALRELPVRQAVLDGEIVALDREGRPSFQLLQGSARSKLRPPLFYYAFDLLHLDGRSLLQVPLEKRQSTLKRLLERGPAALRWSQVFDVPPERLLREARTHGWEGIIAKKAGSLYEPDKRTGAWVKCKVRLEQEFVIGGFTAPRAGREHFGALLLGYHSATGLHYAGKVGAGFSREELARVHRRLQRARRVQCPFIDRPAERHAQWVRPVLVCQVAFAEWTEDGLLRQASYLGLRDDKPAEDVVREMPVSSAQA